MVSVLMTAYNRGGLIAASIESVLQSDYEDFELIIVDDCSSDNTLTIAKEYEQDDSRIRVFANQQNLGDYPNRNHAASKARGKYIKYLDSDDIIYPHGLGVMVKGMEAFPNAGFGLMSVSDPQNSYPSCIGPREIYLESFAGYGHFDRAPGSAIIRSDVFHRIGGFSGKRMIGDIELWMRIAQEYSMVKLQRDLGWDRVHPQQESQSAYANEYGKLRLNVILAALNDKGCPLSLSEINMVERRIKKNNTRRKIGRILSALSRAF